MTETEHQQSPPAVPQSPPKKTGRQRKNRQLLRIEELEKVMQASGGDVDPETIVSLYMPHRKRRLIAAALLQLDRMWLWFIGLIAIVVLLFAAAFAQEKMGNFTINLNRLELFRKGIAIDADPNFSAPTARLTADTVIDATNISLEDIPLDVADIDGSHNGDNYMAYTYYVRNAGKEDLDYIARIRLTSASKGVEDALRVAVWRNGERTVFAEPSASGQPEKDCVNFETRDVVCTFTEPDFKVGYVDKYTIVIWLEGNDPECVDKIVGGSVELTMDIDSKQKRDVSLLSVFLEDIRDTLTGNSPIGAAGTQAPNYYKKGDVNWYTRRNQDGSAAGQ